MSEYKCHGCGKSFDGGNVLIGRNQKHKEGSILITLHPQGIKTGTIEEISDYALNNTDCCVNQYFNKDRKNDIYYAKVIPFNQLEKELMANNPLPH